LDAKGLLTTGTFWNFEENNLLDKPQSAGQSECMTGYAGFGCTQGLNSQKISGGLTSAYSLSLSLHTGNSASLTTAGGLKLTPQSIPGHLVWGG
jgi:hypothetical protein